MTSPPRQQPYPPPAWRPAPTGEPPQRRDNTNLIALVLVLSLTLVIVVAFGALLMTRRPGSPPAAGPAAPAAEQPTDAGIPPTPDAATRAAYLTGLDAIDPDIVHGKPDTAVNRGRDVCAAMRGQPLDWWVEPTRQRFTSPAHPGGFDTATVVRVVDVVHRRLCPAY